MELIYIWIAEYGCIKEQGFNFSPEYECSMEKLSHKKWRFSMSFTGKINIMRSESNNFILTVTLLAGMNGAGKTTLMKYLNSFHCFYDKEAEGDEYREYVQDENRRQTAVYVFRCQKEKYAGQKAHTGGTKVMD